MVLSLKQNPGTLEPWNFGTLDLARVLPLAGTVEHRFATARIRISVVAATMVALIGSWTPHASEPMPDDELIRRIVVETTRSDVALKAFRAMRAGTLSGKHQGWMDVETAVDPSSGFSWRVIGEGGSERTRNKVFREMMKAESEAPQRGDCEAAAFTPANYVFRLRQPSATGRIEIGLEPRREDARLIVGTLTVTDRGIPIRLEGKLAKSPSFWVKSVTIVKQYERIEGFALPTEIESIADVKFVGQSSFSMRYQYREVNGRVMTAPPQSAHDLSFNPSRKILALFRASAGPNR